MRIPNNIQLNKECQYCIGCFSKNIKRVFRDGLTYYYCDACGKTLERSLVIDNGIVWWVDKTTREYWHESVGIFVFDSENKAIYPFALAIPAGHLDSNEMALPAVIRELNEETGIHVERETVKLFSEEDVAGDQCRRGADHHRWHLYCTTINKKEPVLEINNEGVKPEWLTLEEAIDKKLVYSVKYFIEKYGDKLLKNTRRPGI